LAGGGAQGSHHRVPLFLVAHGLVFGHKAGEPLGWQHKLDKNAPGEGAEADQHAIEILLVAEGHAPACLTSEHDHWPLDGYSQHKHDQEHLVVEDALEHVELSITEHTAVELIENLQKNE